MENHLEFLRSDQAELRFAGKGQLGEASKAIEPLLRAFEEADVSALPMRIGKGCRARLETGIEQLKRAGLRRVIRIASPRFTSKQNKNTFGFTRWFDASGEWRECEIEAAVLERYIDIRTGECVIERYDDRAAITLRQSRHIKASDQKKAKNSKAELYVRERYECASCGAALTHVADNTDCPYCGAHITFRFFDWQLDSFHLDMHKDKLIKAAEEAAGKALVGVAAVIAKVIDLLAGAWDKRDAKTRRTDAPKNNNRLGAGLTVLFCIVLLLALGIMAVPWYVRLALGVIVAALIVRGVIRYRKRTKQERMKKQIVRYSDAYLRSCVYDEVWKGLDTDSLIDFSVDDIRLNAVENTETTTTIEIAATVIEKRLLQESKIDIAAEDVVMKLSRARYPERKKSKGKIMTEKTCPNCGADFEPDENDCCSYCGYGLKIENYVWRRVA